MVSPHACIVYLYIFATVLSLLRAATESKEHTLKAEQEKQRLAFENHRLETLLESSRDEVAQIAAHNSQLREKTKEFNGAKITADRKAAEILTRNSKIEVCAAIIVVYVV